MLNSSLYLHIKMSWVFSSYSPFLYNKNQVVINPALTRNKDGRFTYAQRTEYFAGQRDSPLAAFITQTVLHLKEYVYTAI